MIGLSRADVTAARAGQSGVSPRGAGRLAPSPPRCRDREMSAPPAPASVESGGSPPATSGVEGTSPSASEAPLAAAALPSMAAAGATEKRRASHPACARCRRGKIKCVAGENGQLPCAACVTRGVGSLCTRAEPGSSAYGAEFMPDGSVSDALAFSAALTKLNAC